MWTVLVLVAIIIILLALPLLGLGAWFGTDTGQSVNDAINWVFNGGWAVIIFGGILWMCMIAAIVVTPFTYMSMTSAQKNVNNNQQSTAGLISTLIINFVCTIIPCLIARWCWPFGWARTVVMWLTILSLVAQCVLCILRLPRKPSGVPATLSPTMVQSPSAVDDLTSVDEQTTEPIKPSSPQRPKFTAD